jgi:hypothetical protein
VTRKISNGSANALLCGLSILMLIRYRKAFVVLAAAYVAAVTDSSSQNRRK